MRIWFGRSRLNSRAILFPPTPDEILSFLLDHEDVVKDALEAMLVKLRQDYGRLMWPTVEGPRKLSKNLTLEITASGAMSGIETRHLIEPATDLKENWREHLQSLELVASEPAN